MPRWFTILLIALVGCTGGKQAPPATQPVATTQKATTAPATKPATTQTTRPRTPTPETVTIDLAGDYGPFKPLARGVHRLTPTVRPTAAMMQTIKPLLDDSIPTLITLGGTVKFDGAFPGEKGNWSKWDQGVRELATQHRGKPVQWEVWDEPDRADSFKGNREDFFSVWVRSFHILRSVDPEAVMVGPSISKHDGGYLSEFLKIGKDYHAPAAIVCWHEEGSRQDVAGHVGGVEESFWQDGTMRSYVRVMPRSADAQRYAPADAALYLRPLHSAHRRNTWRGTSHDLAFKLTHLVTDKAEPRSLYFAYAAYAAMGAEGNREARVTGAVTSDVVAVWNPKTRQGTALVGRNFNRAGRFYLAGTVTVSVKGVRGGQVRFQTSRIDDSGKDASKGPVSVTDTKIPISGGEAKLLLKDFGDRDAYIVTFTVLDAPATTTAPSTTQSTTKPSR
jgi:hypothetical protein